ncbi:MAG: winged helix-turn-helix transcriptional regulator [Planctomycetes bacterium]|nr:winged helix-turn-helix transcriptional regulator [Planctomycetota bacterium]
MAPKNPPIDPVRVFRALGHEARLLIAQKLAGGEHCVNDLRELVGLSWGTVSRHLSVLRDAGVIESSKQGNQVVYRLALPCVATFTSCLLAAADGKQVEVRTCCS